MAVSRSRAEMASLIDRFLDGKNIGKWDWDDFTSIRITHPELDKIRVLCALLPLHFPADLRTRAYANEDGLRFLRALAAKLRNEEKFPDLAQLVAVVSKFENE